MVKLNQQQWFVIPLSIQKEGEDYLVGNIDLGEFYQIPQVGIHVINLLQRGDSTDGIRSALVNDQPDLDIDDFVSQLTNMGFIYPAGEEQRFEEKLKTGSSERNIRIRVNPKIARAVFSFPAAICYLAIVGYALAGAIDNPALRLNLHALYIPNHLTFALVTLLLLYLVTSLIHEAGHILAAARYGIQSTLGIGNRLWTLVMEADLTGVLTLPKRQRYLPLLAGLLADILNISVATILLRLLLQSGASDFMVQLTQALILQIVITITWQFNIFLRNDMYYVLCTFFSYPDLDRDARSYLRHLAHSATQGRFGSNNEKGYRDIRLVRWFTLIWVLGRMSALWVLFFVFAPTMLRYIGAAIQAFQSPSSSVWTAYDLTLFIAISLGLLSAGMYMWIRRRRWEGGHIK